MVWTILQVNYCSFCKFSVNHMSLSNVAIISWVVFSVQFQLSSLFLLPHHTSLMNKGTWTWTSVSGICSPFILSHMITFGTAFGPSKRINITWFSILIKNPLTVRNWTVLEDIGKGMPQSSFIAQCLLAHVQAYKCGMAKNGRRFSMEGRRK